MVLIHNLHVRIIAPINFPLPSSHCFDKFINSVQVQVVIGEVRLAGAVVCLQVVREAGCSHGVNDIMILMYQKIIQALNILYN